MLLIVMDNRTYGMTNGQPSPTTEEGWRGPLALHGSGIRPINPLALAIASGANFVARGFAGDPNTLARMIVEGIRWPGFALIEVLSPCVTFRPDQIAWKAKVRRALESPFFDIPAASKALLEDDGFGLGIWFQRELGQGPTPRQVSATVTAIEKELLR
jgi:2-oxoglutarate ferredoxin oxidoreductase subunit beta